jgi:hypothetical protein
MTLPPNEDTQMQASLVIFTVITRGINRVWVVICSQGPMQGQKMRQSLKYRVC